MSEKSSDRSDDDTDSDSRGRDDDSTGSSSEAEIAEKYLEMIQSYTQSGDKRTEEFSIEYMETFENEEGGLSDGLFWILETLFAEADAYCHNPELRGEHHVDEQEYEWRRVKPRVILSSGQANSSQCLHTRRRVDGEDWWDGTQRKPDWTMVRDCNVLSLSKPHPAHNGHQNGFAVGIKELVIWKARRLFSGSI